MIKSPTCSGHRSVNVGFSRLGNLHDDGAVMGRNHRDAPTLRRGDPAPTNEERISVSELHLNPLQRR